MRVIDGDGKQLGIFGITEAISKAKEQGFDLVQMSPDGDLIVAKMMDYGKFLFEKRKQKAQAKAKQQRVQVKEIKIRPSTGEGDQRTKLNNIRQFLANGDRVRLTVRFRGREVAHPELGEKILRKMVEEVSDISKVDQDITLDDKRMTALLVPAPVKKAKAQTASG